MVAKITVKHEPIPSLGPDAPEWAWCVVYGSFIIARFWREDEARKYAGWLKADGGGKPVVGPPWGEPTTAPAEYQTRLKWHCASCNGLLTCVACHPVGVDESWKRREAVWARVLGEAIEAQKAAEAALAVFVSGQMVLGPKDEDADAGES